MKNYGTYHINPVKKSRSKTRRRSRGERLRNPYGLVLVNPARKKPRRKSRRRNPTVRRKVGALGWRHKRGTFHYNPVSSAQPSKKMKTRRRGRRRLRNSVRRRTRRRASSVVVIRNPARGRRRGRSRRMRNPMNGFVGEISNSNTLTLGAGIVTAQVGTNMVLNKLRTSQMAVAGSLPGLRPGQESALAVAVYKLVIGAGVGYLLRNQSPRFSQGMIIGAVAGAMSDILMQSRVLQAIPGASTNGTGRYFPGARVGSYTPGVPAMFTGPAASFLNRGAPQPRRGMSAIVNGGFSQRAAMAAPNPFSN